MAAHPVPRLPSGLADRLARLQAFFVRAFGPNGDLKALAVLLAAILFFAIRPSAVGNVKTFDAVPVRVSSSNPYVTVVDYFPKTTSVTLRGPRAKIDSFDRTQLAMEIEEAFPDTEGRVFRPLGAATLAGEEPLKFLSCPTDVVRVELDYTGAWETTDLVAVPALSGRPVEGGTATVRLDEGVAVVVKGSIRKLNAFRDTGLLLPTEPVDVEGKIASFDVPVAIKIPADSGITSVEPQTVLAHVDIAIAVTNRTETALPGLLKDVEPPPTAPALPGEAAPEGPEDAEGVPAVPDEEGAGAEDDADEAAADEDGTVPDDENDYVPDDPEE